MVQIFLVASAPAGPAGPGLGNNIREEDIAALELTDLPISAYDAVIANDDVTAEPVENGNTLSISVL
jgi:hypothetical protein